MSAGHEKTEHASSRFRWRDALRFAAYVPCVYLWTTWVAPWLAGRTMEVLRARGAPTYSGDFQFLFSHLIAFTMIPGAVCGAIDAYFSRRRLAEFVWIIPALVLAYKIATFHVGHSVLEIRFPGPFEYYFSSKFSIPDYTTWQEFLDTITMPDARRGMDQ